MISSKAFYAAIAGMLATLALVGFVSVRPDPVVVRSNLENLPMEIAEYRGIEDSFPESVYRELNADKHVYRHYRAPDGRQVDLYIGYYGTAKGGRTGHNPYACLPGAGWAIVDTGKVKIGDPDRPSKTEVNYVLARRDGVNTVMLHWYQKGKTVMSTGIRQNIERFWGRLLHNRSDGAFVQVTMQVPDDSVVGAEARLEDFAKHIIHSLPQYWPDENC